MWLTLRQAIWLRGASLGVGIAMGLAYEFSEYFTPQALPFSVRLVARRLNGEDTQSVRRTDSGEARAFLAAVRRGESPPQPTFARAADDPPPAEVRSRTVERVGSTQRAVATWLLGGRS